MSLDSASDLADNEANLDETGKKGIARYGARESIILRCSMVVTNDWRKRISSHKGVHHGVPCIVGTRVPVSVIVGSIAEGDTFEQVLASYPQLTREDLQAALLYAAEAVNCFDFIPISK